MHTQTCAPSSTFVLYFSLQLHVYLPNLPSFPTRRSSDLHEYDRLFLYLNCPGLEATNWRGEQAIRPAVVARKVWGGNRTENGAHAQEVLTSVLRTSRQRAADPLPSLAALLRSPKSYVLDFGSHYPARC